MARAYSIWIVRLADSPEKLIGSWTVKHEMVAWLTTCGLVYNKLEIIRMIDKHPEKGPEVMDIRKLLRTSA